MDSKSKNANPRSGDGASPGKFFIGGLPKDTLYRTRRRIIVSGLSNYSLQGQTLYVLVVFLGLGKFFDSEMLMNRVRGVLYSSASTSQRGSSVGLTIREPTGILNKQELTSPLLILARPFPLLLGPISRLANLGKTTRTAFQLHVSLLISTTSRQSTSLLLATTTSKHTPSLGFLELENSQMYDSISDDELYESLITEFVHNLLSDYTFRMMQGTYRYWDLRLTCDYAHQDGKHELRGITMHGLWLCRISGSSVVHLSKYAHGDEWLTDLKTTAESFLDQLDPEVKSKMDLHWYSVRHTSESKKLWIEQMCKHGYLSFEYWEKAIEAAMPFLSSNGILNIMKILKEEMFVNGNYTSQELQDTLYKRTCRRIDLKFKKMSGKTYPAEFGLLHDSKLNFLNYPSSTDKIEKLVSTKFILEQLGKFKK